MYASSTPLPHQGSGVHALLNGQFGHEGRNTAHLPDTNKNKLKRLKKTP
jgi:hypothetical protein